MNSDEKNQEKIAVTKKGPFIMAGLVLLIVIAIFLQRKVSVYSELKEEMAMLPDMAWYEGNFDLMAFTQLDLANLSEEDWKILLKPKDGP